MASPICHRRAGLEEQRAYEGCDEMNFDTWIDPRQGHVTELSALRGAFQISGYPTRRACLVTEFHNFDSINIHCLSHARQSKFTIHNVCGAARCCFVLLEEEDSPDLM